MSNVPVGSSYAWRFTDTNNNQVTANNSNSSWQGILVTSGTVDVALDGAPLAPKSVTVNDRTNFAFSAVNPVQLSANTITCYDRPTITLPSPPLLFSPEGYSCANMAFDTTQAQVNDNGPNHGYWYVTSVVNNFETYPTQFEFIVVSDLLDSTSIFYTSQCGTYSDSNPAGFIAGAQLKQNVFEHEAGSTKSHWTQYRDAQNDSLNNVGTVLEATIGIPGTSETAYKSDLTVNGKAAISRIADRINEAGVCNGSVNYDSSQSCKYCGPINFEPYQTCAGAVPVPHWE